MAATQIPEEMLIGYATGAITPGLALLTSAHLDACPESRGKVADIGAAGGALLLEECPAALSDGALEEVLAAIDAPAPDPEPRRLEPGPLPARLIEVIGLDFDRIPWKFRLPGLGEYEIDGYGAEKVSLLRGRPGAGIPQHTHEGREATLVLTGLLQDGERLYRAGDVTVNDEHDEHTPRIVGTETCYCLVVMTGPLRFTGMFSRALNYLAD